MKIMQTVKRLTKILTMILTNVSMKATSIKINPLKMRISSNKCRRSCMMAGWARPQKKRTKDPDKRSEENKNINNKLLHHNLETLVPLLISLIRRLLKVLCNQQAVTMRLIQVL